jgi:hypothetical protein
MIKGVNKKVIEINNPESQYFDKVVLYVKPNRETYSKGELTQEVDKYLKSLDGGKAKPRRRASSTIDINKVIGTTICVTIVLIVVLMLLLV